MLHSCPHRLFVGITVRRLVLSSSLFETGTSPTTARSVSSSAALVRAPPWPSTTPSRARPLPTSSRVSACWAMPWGSNLRKCGAGFEDARPRQDGCGVGRAITIIFVAIASIVVTIASVASGTRARSQATNCGQQRSRC